MPFPRPIRPRPIRLRRRPRRGPRRRPRPFPVRFALPQSRPVASALLAFALAFAAEAASAQSIRLLDSMKIRDEAAGFDEPSGLSLSADGTFLWSVSDNADEVFRLGFDGKLLPGPRPRLPWKDQAEGVAATPDGRALIVAREKGARLARMDLATGDAETVRLADLPGWAALAPHFESADNDGLEGVAVDPADGRVWLLREAGPRLLIGLSPALDRIETVRDLDAAAGFDEALGAAKDGEGRLDVSGLAIGAAGFWIVSDRGERLFLLPRDGGPARSWPLTRSAKGKPLKNAEGVAWDPARGRLHVVSDDKGRSRLVVYAVEDPRGAAPGNRPGKRP